MTSERQQDHLTPEVFVDVLEGSPVEASWRQHLENCSDCRQELEALEQTLAILKEDVGTAAPLALPSVERSLSRWWTTAAAVVIAAGAAYWMSVDRSWWARPGPGIGSSSRSTLSGKSRSSSTMLPPPIGRTAPKFGWNGPIQLAQS